MLHIHTPQFIFLVDLHLWTGVPCPSFRFHSNALPVWCRITVISALYAPLPAVLIARGGVLGVVANAHWCGWVDVWVCRCGCVLPA